MNKLADNAQYALDAAMLASRTGVRNHSGVTLHGDAENAAQSNVAPLSTVLAKVCTCQITRGNRIDSASCPRHAAAMTKREDEG